MPILWSHRQFSTETVNGDIIASERLELGRTARVVGNIQTPRLLIEDGAIFEGGCSMLRAKEAFEKKGDETSVYHISNGSAPYQLTDSNGTVTDEYPENIIEADETANAAVI